jgi:hypothetical protein
LHVTLFRVASGKTFAVQRGLFLLRALFSELGAIGEADTQRGIRNGLWRWTAKMAEAVFTSDIEIVNVSALCHVRRLCRSNVGNDRSVAVGDIHFDAECRDKERNRDNDGSDGRGDPQRRFVMLAFAHGLSYVVAWTWAGRYVVGAGGEEKRLMPITKMATISVER